MSKVIVSLLSILVCLVGCTSQVQTPSPTPSAEDEIIGYTLLDPHAAVLTEDTALTDCYSYVLTQGYGTPDADDSQFYQWLTLEEERPLSQGDVVAVLEEADGLSRVVVPYGDLPWLYGFLPTDLLSTEQSEIERGNQAILDDCETYDAPNGTLLHPQSARVKIIIREGAWAKVQAYGTGTDPYWVRAADLSFDFSESLPDQPQ